ncbi:DUF2851 family protein [Siphonobacter sp. SORGH_AS_1065]|uniref:DUF2851 family protein n=1 Tax=Siphonobacter sp. SORGH_AS_1065 TaxID=3041795 RepID=UPI002786ABD0|nr:DUF2851 family protein [Siphonobacter sp. SORGH_AS_1065]MDQ1088413.1 hypothetical protein [Siphonobacter sp. SORGH_AS_1065]
MTEDFIHYLWQFQKFDRTDLQTCAGEKLQILSVGQAHTHAGPDFQNAQLIINSIKWAGTVEIHRRSSDWIRHTHQTDEAYENVILHVVWIHDQAIFRKDGSEIPTLALQNRTDETWLQRYRSLMDGKETLACGAQFASSSELSRRMMLDRTLIERLSVKSQKVQQILESTQNDWEETSWQMLGRSMGASLNADPMEWLTRLVPLKILRKHRNQPFQMEALVFGASGLIPENPTDTYVIQLQKEAHFLMKKYQIEPLPKSVWKFLRLRPASFPTVRMAQLVQLAIEPLPLFSFILSCNETLSIEKQWQVRPSAYWQSHYTFEKPTKQGITQLGKDTIQRMVINAVVPLLTAFSHYKDDPTFLDRAIELLEKLPSETNTWIDTWKKYGLKCQNAADSQAALEWVQSYCNQRKCLNCSVGIGVLKG